MGVIKKPFIKYLFLLLCLLFVFIRICMYIVSGALKLLRIILVWSKHVKSSTSSIAATPDSVLDISMKTLRRRHMANARCSEPVRQRECKIDMDNSYIFDESGVTYEKYTPCTHREAGGGSDHVMIPM